MAFAEFLETARTWASANLPIAVGGFVAVAVLTFLAVNAAFRRRPFDPDKLAPAHANAVAAEKALSWEPGAQSYADRRGAVRREGQPVRVTLAAGTFRNGVAEGFVIDRSTGGLRIAATAAVAPGSVIQARAAHAPDTVGYVPLIVRCCRKSGEFFELGCEFEQTPPWNVLLLFG
jgi:hypothetical protein